MKAIARYPGIVERFYSLYRETVILLPFLRASYKWYLLKLGALDFEIERAGGKGLGGIPSSTLLSLSFGPGPAVSDTGTSRREAGRYEIDLSRSGIYIYGCVAPGKPGSVFILVDGRPVRKQPVSENRCFHYKIKPEVVKRFGKLSTLTVEHPDGSRLAYGESDSVILEAPFGDGSISEVVDKGSQLSKKGGIAVRGEALEGRYGEYLKLYARVRETFMEAAGKELFLTYGTLLGFHRNGDFIPNDDDFDCGYVSELPSPRKVRDEALAIARKLIRSGLDVSLNPIGKLMRVSASRGLHLDIKPLWFEGPWCLAYQGFAFRAVIGDFLPAREGSLRGSPVLTPRNPEALLAGYYGPGWRVPDPSYTHDKIKAGKDFSRKYLKFLVSPYRFRKEYAEIERERPSHPGMGRFRAGGAKHFTD